MRLVRFVTDLPEPDEDREKLRLEGVDRVACGARFGVRLKLGPDRPRCRVKDSVDPVRSGRLTNDGRDGVRTWDFPAPVTEGLDGLRLVRLMKEPLDPDEGREKLRLEAVERADCGTRFGVRMTFTPELLPSRASGRCRVNDRVDPVRSERLTVDRRDGTRTTDPSEPLLATLERRELAPARRSRVRTVDRDANPEERTPLLEVTEFGPRPRGRRSSLGSPCRKPPTMALDATTRVLPGPLPRSRP